MVRGRGRRGSSCPGGVMMGMLVVGASGARHLGRTPSSGGAPAGGTGPPSRPEPAQSRLRRRTGPAHRPFRSRRPGMLRPQRRAGARPGSVHLPLRPGCWRGSFHPGPAGSPVRCPPQRQPERAWPHGLALTGWAQRARPQRARPQRAWPQRARPQRARPQRGWAQSASGLNGPGPNGGGLSRPARLHQFGPNRCGFDRGSSPPGSPETGRLQPGWPESGRLR